jgi:hypothetical protein
MRLSELRSQLRSFLSGDWSGILLNPNYLQDGHTMTWHNYSSMMAPDPLSFEDVATLSKARQYSFQLSVDGSLFQFYYSYDRYNREISEARIAYYEANGAGFSGDSSGLHQAQAVHSDDESATGPLPVLGPDEGGPRATQLDKRGPRWFRIDFRANGPKSILHHTCHLHLGGFPGSRLIVAGVPTPKQFVEFVVCCCYPDLYRSIRLNAEGDWRDQKRIENVNAMKVHSPPNVLFQQITHLRIPGA